MPPAPSGCRISVRPSREPCASASRRNYSGRFRVLVRGAYNPLVFRALTLVTVLTTVTLAAVDGRVRTAAVDPPVPREAAHQFNALVADVHDRRIDRDAARARIRALLPSIAADFHARGGVDAPADAWRFPLATYGSESIGGKNGSGYQPAGYDWFDGYM